MSRLMTTLEAQTEQAHTRTIPAFTYYSPEVYQLELEHLLARSWHLAGPEHKVAKPGDYFVCQAQDVPIVVTRDLGC